MRDQLARTAKAIHTLFYATDAANERYRALRESITTDDELAAYQALSVGLISLEPPSEAVMERMREWLVENDKREAARPKSPPERIRVEAGTGGEEARFFKRLLDKMYTRWQGTLDYERGVHRLCFYSPFDEEFRRHTTFAQVTVDGKTTEAHVRTYVLGPYLLVKDDRTSRESDEPYRVLGGDLTPILPEGEA